MKHVVLVMSTMLVLVLVSGGQAPVKRRDLRYRPNNGFTYQYTSVHSGIEGDVAKAVSYQHRLEQIHDVTRVVPTKPAAVVATSQARVIPAAPVAVAVVAVKAARGPQESSTKPRFPTRQAAANGNGNGSSPSAVDRRRTTVNISRGSLQRHQQQPLAVVAHSHALVQQYH